jgi:phosphate uptake regulator
METRKVQITGRSTYVISLPKAWVNKVKIKNGDSIGMIPRSDGTLLINPKLTERGDRLSEEFTKNIHIDTQETNQLIREFVGVYLAGFNIIEMDFKNQVSKKVRQEIRGLSRIVIGPEIIDESMNSITVKDLLDASDFSIVKGVKRMYIISKGMFHDSLNSFKDKEEELADDIETRDNDVDKLYWLISKQFNLVLRDVFFADKMGIKSQEALNFLFVARSIERIADHASRISQNAKKSKDKTSIDDKIIEIGNLIIKLFDSAINSMYRKDLINSHQIVARSLEIHAKLERIREELLLLKKLKIETIVTTVYIIDSLDRIRGYAEDIAETAINNYFVT